MLSGIKRVLFRYMLACSFLGCPCAHTQEQLDNALMANVETKPGELEYLKAYVLANNPGSTQESLTAAVQAAIEANPSGDYAAEAIYLLGIWQYRKGNLNACVQTLTEFAERYHDHPRRPEALFYTARCLNDLGMDPDRAKKLFTDVYKNAPQAHFAHEAYFYAYPYEEYLIGSPDAVAHLYEMSTHFPESPYVIVSHYLKGMAIKRGLIAGQAKERQQWHRAIEAFQQAQSLFETLVDKGMLAEDQNEFFAALRLRAGIECAQANLAMAMDASSAKRQICLEYAIASYRDLWKLLRESQEPYMLKFRKCDCFQSLLEECHFGLAHAYLQADDTAAAETLLLSLLKNFEQSAISRGYYLAKTYCELADIAIRRYDYSLALERLTQAEEASKGRVLSTDERLEIGLAQSHCHRQLGSVEAAMVCLSQVINDDSISGLRLKAMLVRADLYLEQGRPELAKKQLVALSRKGGDWGRQAQLKLEKHYGSH